MIEKQTHFHFGVYALILNNSKDKILLIKKLIGAYTGMLDLPGGTMDNGETLAETMQREVYEETSLTVINHKQLHTLSTLFDFEKDGKLQSLHHVGTIYQAEVTGTPSDIGDGVDSGGCIWVPIKNIEKYDVVPFVRDILKLLK